MNLMNVPLFRGQGIKGLIIVFAVVLLQGWQRGPDA